ncbi:SAM-dependent methyltransferase [Planomonospora sp. ID82291]|uniref:SAM-dependent methyltransferase n=1 Tax=Planomonospora sp. ID82291 TaxID=2738136 RepID=UPI0018C37C53|nr:SAM-dependent methyltransferase [Planomonospora sp. ID82291]MBG0818426.1 SAM-dependent methyltransferase [Planomonospora sp. ID82291]
MINGEASAPAWPTAATRRPRSWPYREPPLVSTTLFRAHRDFLRYAAALLVDSGIEQYLQVPSGLLDGTSVHEIVQRRRPAARMLYLDDEAEPLRYGLAYLTPAATPYVHMVPGGLGDIAAALAREDAATVLDFLRPIGIILGGITAHEPEPRAIAAALHERAAPGSRLVVSQAVHNDAESSAESSARTVNALPAPSAEPHTRKYVRELMAGWALPRPGMTDVRVWRMPGYRPSTSTHRHYRVVGAIGRREP